MWLANYSTRTELGRGGMATVYLAHDNKFDTDVAIKVLNKEFVNNENIRKRFLAEARSMFKMSHPNIIKVTDLIEDGDTVAFVMEYVEGETLKEYIERKGKLNDSEIKTIFSQMLDAVGYVHEQNLVHRDIKPSNFMLDKNGKIKLMDFGIAKNTDSNSAEYTQTGTGMQMGTPMYMSPEQITETKSVRAQSDIYSLGVVLWQMVTGEKPYDTKTLSSFQLQTKIVNDPLPKSNTVWDRIIEKATQKEVDKRFLNSLFFKEAMYTTSQNTDKKVEVDEEKTIIEQEIIKPISQQKKEVDLKAKEQPNVENTIHKNSNNIPNNNPLEKNKNENSRMIKKTWVIIFSFFILFSIVFGIYWRCNLRNEIGIEIGVFAIEEKIQIASLNEHARGLEKRLEIEEKMITGDTPELKAKAKKLMDYVDQIDKITAQQIQYLDALKLEILNEIKEEPAKLKAGPESIIMVDFDKNFPLRPIRMNLTHVTNKDKYDECMRIFGIDKNLKAPTEYACKHKPGLKGGIELWNQMNDFRGKICELLVASSSTDTVKYKFVDPKIVAFKDLVDLQKKVNEAMKKSKIKADDFQEVVKIYTALTKNESWVDEHQPDGVHWLAKTFNHAPSVAAIASLSGLQKEILTARADVLVILNSRLE